MRADALTSRAFTLVAAKTWMVAISEHPPSSFEARPSGLAPQDEGFAKKNTWVNPDGNSL
jgi:hypothetical protein